LGNDTTKGVSEIGNSDVDAGAALKIKTATGWKKERLDESRYKENSSQVFYIVNR
jgi:hypothetical protein